MPKPIGLVDGLASLIVPDTYAYTLPETIDRDHAPSHLVIDGFGSLELQRTRTSVWDGRTLEIIDQEPRRPLYATAQRGRPAPSAHLAHDVAAGPVIGVGAGKSVQDGSLYNSKSLATMAYFSLLLGMSLIGLSHTLLAWPALGVAVMGMAYAGIHPSFHILAGTEHPWAVNA